MSAFIQTGQHFTGPACNTCQRIVHQEGRQTRRRTNRCIQSAQHGTATGHRNTQIRNIRGQFRRRQFQCLAHGIDNFRNRLGQGGCNLGFGYNRLTRGTGQQITPLYLHGQFVCLVLGRNGGADFLFYFLGRVFTNQQILVLANKIDNVQIHLVARSTNGV